jgi:hypothetical protein
MAGFTERAQEARKGIVVELTLTEEEIKQLLLAARRLWIERAEVHITDCG